MFVLRRADLVETSFPPIELALGIGDVTMARIIYVIFARAARPTRNQPRRLHRSKRRARSGNIGFITAEEELYLE